MTGSMYRQTAEDSPSGSISGDPQDDMLTEVDFKWLMAGQGCWVDPARLKSDANYAQSCIAMAMRLPCEALHACAHHLQATFLPRT